MKIKIKIEQSYGSYIATQAYPYTAGWRGCPLGSGGDALSAAHDLLVRANRESATDYTLNDLDLVSGS